LSILTRILAAKRSLFPAPARTPIAKLLPAIALTKSVSVPCSIRTVIPMGSSQSVISETTIATVLVAGAAVVAYGYQGHKPQLASQPTAPEAASKPKATKKKKKQTGNVVSSSDAAIQPNPVVVPAPTVIPGGFDAASGLMDTDPPAPVKATKSKKKKGKKVGTPGSGTPRSAPVDAMSDSSATAPETHTSSAARPQASKRKSSTPKPITVDQDENWTRVDSRPRTGASNLSLVEGVVSDAGVTTTSLTGNSSSVAEHSESEKPASRADGTSENRRTLAERLLPKPRKTGVDDMLETPDYPTVARVMRIQPGPNDKPAAGFSWADYEDVDDPRGTADDADGEDDSGWGVVKSRGRAKTVKSPSQTPTAPEAMTKKQRQNAAKREAQKTAKAESEAERQARLARHKRELEQAKIAEQYSKSSKSIGGGMNPYVDEKGKLVFEL